MTCICTMRSSLQERGLDSHPIFLGILYSATINLETYLIYNHSVVKDCNSQNVYASTKQMSKILVTINPPNKPISCSLLAEIPDLTIAQVANPYVSIFLTHITMSNHLHCSLPLLTELFLDFFYAHTV